MVRARTWIVIASALLLLAGAGMQVRKLLVRVLADPSVALLLPEGGAQWIGLDRPFSTRAYWPGEVVTHFRKDFKVKAVPRPAFLTLRAMTGASLSLDGRVIVPAGTNPRSWKSPRRVDLGPWLAPGKHVLVVTVTNRMGPPVLLAYSKALRVFTGEGWQASRDKKSWTPARPVDRPRPASMSRWLPRADRALLSRLPLLLPVFGLVFLLTLVPAGSGERGAWVNRIKPSPRAVCGILLVAWAVLAINNFQKVPTYVGFDGGAHVKYIRVFAETGRVPLSDEGWKMSEPPLYYMISALPYLLLSKMLTLETTLLRWLRLLSILCGALQAVVCYRAARHVFPERQDLQTLGTIIGGLLPMNLYASQAIANEPLGALLSGALIVVALGLVREIPLSRPTRRLTLLGLSLGAAILTRTTAVLLVPPLVLLLLYCFLASGWRARRVAFGMGAVLGLATLVAGWYYARNWVEIGRPFVGGWEPRGVWVWWQDPGYRTPGQFLRFGEALLYPVYASLVGLWDSLWATFWADGLLSGIPSFDLRPPWNYDFMLVAGLLAMLPATGILLGVFGSLAAPTRSLRDGRLFAVCCLGIYLAAVLFIYLKVPIYSTAKATYTAGLTPCYAVLAAAGLSPLLRLPVARAVVWGWIACWGMTAYLAFFAV